MGTQIVKEALIKSGAQIAPQIFRQIVQILRRQADAFQARFVQYDEKDASKRTAKAKAGNYAALP